MPHVGKDKATLELQRQRYLEELDLKNQNYLFIKKARQHLKDTGQNLIQPKEKDTLESLIDRAKIDENLEKLTIKDLGSSPGQVKPFIQSLDDTLKEFLLDRFEAFKKVFKENFTVPTSANLKSAFEIFNRQEIEKMKEIEIPTPLDIRNYLLGLNEFNLIKIGFKMIEQINPITAPNDKQVFESNITSEPNQRNKVNTLEPIIREFVSRYNNELEGYTALFLIFKNLGLSDAPKPSITQNRTGVPAPFINVPVSSSSSSSAPTIKVMGVERFKTLAQLNRNQLEDLVKEFNDEYKDYPKARKDISAYKKITKIKEKTKEDLVRMLIARGYDPRTGDFNIPQAIPLQPYIPNDESLGDQQLIQLEDHMKNFYNNPYTNPTVKKSVKQDLTQVEGFGVSKKMAKIYKLGK